VRQSGEVDIIVDNAATFRPLFNTPLLIFPPLNAYLGLTGHASTCVPANVLARYKARGTNRPKTRSDQCLCYLPAGCPSTGRD